MSHQETPTRVRATLPIANPPTISAKRSIVDAMKLMTQHDCNCVITTIRGEPAILTQADVDRVLPSPATSLARYEVPARLERISVRHAVHHPSPTISIDASIESATSIMRANAWVPIIVMADDRVRGVLTTSALLERLLEQRPNTASREALNT
jgi:acetoin utilization protein AcuB